MSLTVVTGKAITGKTGVLHRALIEGAAKGSGSVLLLPSHADVRRDRVELAARVPLGIRIETVDQWAESLWALYGTGERLITPTVRSALMRSTLRSLRDTNPLASSRGYHELAQAVAERSAGLELPAATSAADRQLIEAVDAYRRACRAHRVIEPGEVMHRMGECCPVAGLTIAVNRFTDLSRAQEAFLVGLSAGNEVLVALNWDQNSLATQASTDLVRRLLLHGGCGQHLEAPAPRTELAEVEARLYDPQEPLKASGAVRLMVAAGDEAECALVARALSEQIEQGVPSHEIAIVFRDLARREHLLRAALEGEGLACEVDLAVPLARTALGRALTSLLSVVTRAAGREALTAFLLSPYSGATATSAELLDARARTYRIDEPDRLLDLASGLSDRTRTVVQAARALGDSKLDEAGAHAWERLVTSAVANALDRGERAKAEQVMDGSVHGLIISAAGELASLALPDVSAPDLLDHLASAKAHSGGEEREGFIYVTEAHRLRSRRFRTIVIGGLTADEFSSEKREPVAVQFLQRLGLPAGTEERLSERMLFYSLVTRARESLVLVRQSSTAAGNELRPSTFWDEIRDLYRSPEQVESGEGEGLPISRSLPLSELEAAAPCFTPQRRELRQRIAGGGLRAAEPLRGAIAATPWAEPEREFSVTEIETYHACPYRWFYDRVVRPRQLDMAFDAKERGSLIHQVLAEFYRRLPDSVGPRVTPDSLAGSLDLLDTVWDETTREAESGTRGLAERLALREAREWVRESVIVDSTLLWGFRPQSQEWAFGARGERLFSWGSVRLKGSVDRLDEGDGSLVVTDYKSSSSVSGCSSFAKEGLLQVLVYAEAAGRLLSRRVAGGLYRSLPTGELRGFWNADVSEPEDWVAEADVITDAEYQNLLAWAGETIEQAAAGIRAADIAQRPRFKQACTWCGAQAFCEEATT